MAPAYGYAPLDDMPVWGSLFQKSGSEDAIKPRISSLIGYLKSIQIK
jgi:hypothetical protein